MQTHPFGFIHHPRFRYRLPMPSETLPAALAESIAIVSATCVGVQPAILANLALAQQIFATNLEQQTAVSQQQALNLVRLAVVTKCVSLILGDTSGKLETVKEVVGLLKEVQSPASATETASAAAGAQASAASAAPKSPADGLDETIAAEVIAAAAIANVKAIGEQPAMLSNLAYSNVVATTNLSQQNAVANQQAMNELGIAIVGKTVDVVSKIEARAAVEGTDSRELADQIAELRAVIQAFSQKSA
jgi:Killing trait